MPSANGPHRICGCKRIHRRPNIDLRRACKQGDADRLTTWYSGWYNGLAKKHYFNIARSKELEHEVIVYCKASPQIASLRPLPSCSSKSGSRPDSNDIALDRNF